MPQETYSGNLAWFIGAVAGGGNVNYKRAVMQGGSHELLKEFATVGESTFSVPARWGSIGKVQTVTLFSKSMADLLGDLRGQRWPQTFRDKHTWILDQPIHTWRFLGGILDSHSQVRYPNPKAIIFTFHNLEAVNLISDICTHVGINRLGTATDKTKRTGVDGLGIYNLQDLKTVAANVRSVVPQKQLGLDYFKDIVIQYPAHIESEDDVIREWSRLKQALGHSPTVRELRMLRRADKTLYTESVYSYRFGGENNRFSVARARLDEFTSIVSLP